MKYIKYFIISYHPEKYLFFSCTHKIYKEHPFETIYLDVDQWLNRKEEKKTVVYVNGGHVISVVSI